MAADLHIHTTISDGTETPRQIVHHALALGLKTIAITDHDIIDGYFFAQDEAADKNIEVLAGVEISCFADEQEIHILGYFAEPQHPELTHVLAEMRRFRVTRGQLIVDKLKQMGIELDWQTIIEIAGEGSVGRPHIADALVQKGLVSNREEAFKKYLDRGCPAFVPRKKVTPIEAIKLISRAKGVAVFVHPGAAGSVELLRELAEQGLKGVEVWHPHHSLLQSEYYLKLTKEMGLIPTGGSDYHGAKHKTCNRLGAFTAPMESVTLIKNALG